MRILPAALSLVLALLPSLANAECTSSYMPLGVGSTWTYTQVDGTNAHTTRVSKVDGDKFVLEMTKPAGEVSNAKTPKTDMATSFEGSCIGDGIRMTFQMTGSRANGGQATIETVSEEGYAFPRDAGVKVGAQWNESRVTKMVAQGGKSGKSMTMKMTTKTTHKIVAKESVTVPAGTFDAFKFVSETETTTEMDGPMAAMMRGAVGAPQKSTQTLWVVKGVGMVKQDMSAAAAAGSPAGASVLTSYKVH